MKRRYFISENFLHKIFIVSLMLKGIDGILETIGGVLLIFLKSNQLIDAVNFLFARELIEDPHDLVGNILIKSISSISEDIKIFVALFLLIHGIIKILIIIGLLKEKLWVYPLGIWVFSLFGVYQMYQYSYSKSFGLIILTILDIIVVLLTLHEYNFLKNKSLYE